MTMRFWWDAYDETQMTTRLRRWCWGSYDDETHMMLLRFRRRQSSEPTIRTSQLSGEAWLFPKLDGMRPVTRPIPWCDPEPGDLWLAESSSLVWVTPCLSNCCSNYNRRLVRLGYSRSRYPSEIQNTSPHTSTNKQTNKERIVAFG